MTKRVAIYARLSISKDESVSIARQLDACRKYAAARGWEVAGEFTDDGVSATANKPEDRAGWGALLASEHRYDGVVVWKVDRLARRVLDFLHADEALQARGAGIVCVEDPVDMTTPTGRAFATMLAVFGEMEAAAISARVTAARNHLIRTGRVVGGTVPYGWRSVPNPSGAGMVLAQDPERIAWVRGMAERALRGDTVYSIKRWLDAEGAPLPEASQANRRRAGWHYKSVERLLRSPVLAGMTPHNPGRGQHEDSAGGVLRDESGLPVVDPSVAVVTTEERREIVERLDGRDSPQARRLADKESTSPLLSRVATCDDCRVFMSRGTTQGRPSLRCPSCGQTVSRNQLDPHLEARLLGERGGEPMIEATRVPGTDNAAALGDVEEAIRLTAMGMAADGADVGALSARVVALREERARLRLEPPSEEAWSFSGRTVREAWDAAEDDLARREVLLSQLASLRIRRGRGGRNLDTSRVLVEWHPDQFARFPSVAVTR